MQRRLLIDEEPVPTKFSIVFEVEMAELSVEVGSALRPERVDMFLCPLKLEPGTVERLTHSQPAAVLSPISTLDHGKNTENRKGPASVCAR